MQQTATPSDIDSRVLVNAQLGRVFTPGAPVDKYELFAGRRDLVLEIVNCINQRGQHAIIYGERGVGKTSLANVLHEVLSNSGLQSLNSGTINCDGTDNFSGLWSKIFRDLTHTHVQLPLGFKEPQYREESLEHLIRDDLTPDDIRYYLKRYDIHSIIILDEVDRIKDKQITTLLADTIKNLSDHSSNVTLILVGVADSVNDLIGEHLSIQRALVQVLMPRMSIEELALIIDKGLSRVNMTIDEAVKIKIADLSQGLPHYTHLLGLHASQNAVNHSRRRVNADDLRVAVEHAVTRAHQTLITDYYKAISSPRKNNLYASVLLACAQAKKDQQGYFFASAVRAPLTKLLGKLYDIPQYARHLNEFRKPERGPILKKTGTQRRYRYRFVDPMMQPYVLMHAQAEGIMQFEI